MRESQLLFLVDQLGERWKDADALREELTEEIIRCVREHGSRPAKTPGMRIAQGAEFELALISAMRYVVKDQRAAARLYRRLPRRFADRVLRRKVVFVPVPGGEKAILRNRRTFALSKSYLATVKVKRCKPRIRVRELKNARRKAA